MKLSNIGVALGIAAGTMGFAAHAGDHRKASKDHRQAGFGDAGRRRLAQGRRTGPWLAVLLRCAQGPCRRHQPEWRLLLQPRRRPAALYESAPTA